MEKKKVLLGAGVAVTGILIFGTLFMAGRTHTMADGSSHSLLSEHKSSNEQPQEEPSKESKQNPLELKFPLKKDINRLEIIRNDGKSDVVTEEEILEKIEYVQYTVKENDTLWRIARTYMPNYNAHPKEDIAGVIAYIAKENNLQKLYQDYVIYIGQKITIPKQKNIALNSSTNNNVNTVKKVDNTKTTTNKGTSTASQSTSGNAASASNNTSTGSNTTSGGSQTEHTGHSSH